MDLKELITEGESFLMSVRRTSFGDYIADSKGYAEWGAKFFDVFAIIVSEPSSD